RPHRGVFSERSARARRLRGDGVRRDVRPLPVPVPDPRAAGPRDRRAGDRAGFDLFYTQDAPLDYAFYVPLHFTMPEPSVPLVPLHVNVYLPPQPTPRRCYEWGRALGEILRARSERVVLMASGGMSHFPGTDRYAS